MMRSVGVRVRVSFAVLGLLLAPATAIAVRPHASPVLQAPYSGSDPEGRVSFHMTIAFNDAIPGRPAFYAYSIDKFRFATECSPRGVRLPGGVDVRQTRRRRSQVAHFTYRGRGFSIRATLSGNLGTPAVHGTVRISERGCDGDALPFSASPVG